MDRRFFDSIFARSNFILCFIGLLHKNFADAKTYEVNDSKFNVK